MNTSTESAGRLKLKYLVYICETLNCGILDVIELEQDEIAAETAK